MMDQRVSEEIDDCKKVKLALEEDIGVLERRRNGWQEELSR